MIHSRLLTTCIATLVAIPMFLGIASTAQAQKHHHARLKSLIAGAAAYKIAKHTGKKRLAAGRHRNFLQRHPVMTGVGAYAIAHHHLKHKHHRG